MNIEQLAQIFNTNYVVIGYDYLTKKKESFNISSESVELARSEVFKTKPRLIIQAIYPDVVSTIEEDLE